MLSSSVLVWDFWLRLSGGTCYGSSYVYKSHLLGLFVTDRELFVMWSSGTSLFCVELEQRITHDCIYPRLSWTNCFPRFLCYIKNMPRIIMSQICLLKSVVKSEIQWTSGCRRVWLWEYPGHSDSVQIQGGLGYARAVFFSQRG